MACACIRETYTLVRIIDLQLTHSWYTSKYISSTRGVHEGSLVNVFSARLARNVENCSSAGNCISLYDDVAKQITGTMFSSRRNYTRLDRYIVHNRLLRFCRFIEGTAQRSPCAQNRKLELLTPKTTHSRLHVAKSIILQWILSGCNVRRGYQILNFRPFTPTTKWAPVATVGWSPSMTLEHMQKLDGTSVIEHNEY